MTKPYDIIIKEFAAVVNRLKSIRDISKVTEFIKNEDKDRPSDFLTAPASTKFHGGYQGGLMEHSTNVALILEELTVSNKLVWQDPTSPLVVGLFHDLCKVNCYKPELKNRKTGTDERGKAIWEEYTGYEFVYPDHEDIIGVHGDKSVLILNELMDLTNEEVSCIRFHMGPSSEYGENQAFSKACERNQNVLFTHVADRLAAIREVNSTK